MVFLQGNKNFAIHRTDSRTVAQGDVDTAVGEAEIVEDDVDLLVADDFANRRFDLCDVGFRLFELRACGSSEVKPHLACIHLREEIGSQPRK